MDKHKLKNIALGVSLGLNVLLGFFFGGGLISSCTAKKAETPASSVSADASGEIIDGLQNRALNPRFAANDNIDPEEYPNLWHVNNTTYGSYLFYRSATRVTHYFNDAGLIQAMNITTAGLYYVEINLDPSVFGNSYFVNTATYNSIFTATEANNYDAYKEATKGYIYVSPSMISSGVWLLVSQTSYQVVAPKVYFIDGEYLPASEIVTFPREFFPWQIWGDRASDVLISGPSVTSSTTRESQVLFFNDVFFRSNGKVYKQIALVFTFSPGTYLGKYTGAGDVYANGRIVYSTSNPPWYLSRMVYYPADGTDGDIALTANFQQGGDNLLLMPNPIWASDGYRRLELLYYDNATMSNVPSGVGNNTPRQWLDVLAQVENVVTNSGGDPFTLLSNGFSAVANILSIPILPFLTLGTLIFVPLIVLVILAILRLLAK